MSSTIWNGDSRSVSIDTGKKLSVVAVSGTYTVLTTAGAGAGTALATNATGGTYGPYAGPITVLLTSSALSEVDYDVAVTPVIVSDTVVTASTNPLTGGLALMGPDGPLALSGYHPDFNVDCIVSGMALPTTGGLTNSITAGVAYITGYRRAFVGTNITLTASSDNYIDAKPDGTYAVLPVANGAGAPAVTVNALRLGYVVTGASTVSSAAVTGKDSLGNWMGNRSPKAAVILGGVTNQSAAAGTDVSINFGLPSTISGYGPEILDNQGVHSATTNSHRVPILVTGLYRLSAQCALGASAGATTLAIRKNANLTAGIPTASVTPAAPQTLAAGGLAYLTAGDFVYVRVNSAAGTALTEVAFFVTPA